MLMNTFSFTINGQNENISIVAENDNTTNVTINIDNLNNIDEVSFEARMYFEDKVVEEITSTIAVSEIENHQIKMTCSHFGKWYFDIYLLNKGAIKDNRDGTV